MTLFDVPDPTLEPVPLAIERRQTLGTALPADLEEPRDRISIGKPRSTPLDVAALDEDARAFLAGREGSRFLLLGVNCSFRADERVPIESAWLEVNLTTAAPDGGEEPIAWSMEPLSLSDDLEVSSSVKLDASLKLTSSVIPIEIGPSAASERTVSGTVRKPYVEAFREGTPRPSWVFTGTPATEVRGVHRLRMVVELPAQATGRAEIRVGATLRHRLLGIFRYRAKLEDLPDRQSVTFAP